MHAHHAAITVPVGSLVASLSVLGHGTAATMDPASIDPAFMGQDGMGGDGMLRAITHVADMLIALALADSVDSWQLTAPSGLSGIAGGLSQLSRLLGFEPRGNSTSLISTPSPTTQNAHPTFDRRKRLWPQLEHAQSLGPGEPNLVKTEVLEL